MMTAEQTGIIATLSAEVQALLEQDSSGHDWWHTNRVLHLAQNIARAEGADEYIVSLGAILHDIADWKFHGGSESAGPEKARELMAKHAIPEDVIAQVADIVAHVSYKGANVENLMKSEEGFIVQDADRLDAIGAIGIARVFAYGGHAGHQMHDPSVKPVMHATKEAYFKSKSTGINHFYEKLLLLKDRMHTATARKLAEGRHAFMEEYLKRFYAEWEGIA